MLAGGYEVQGSRILYFLSQYKASEVAMKEITSLESEMLVKDAADQLLRTQNRNFIVTAKGKAIGSLSREDNVNAISHNQNDENIGAVMNIDLQYIDESTPLDEAWKTLETSKRWLDRNQSDRSIRGGESKRIHPL